MQTCKSPPDLQLSAQEGRQALCKRRQPHEDAAAFSSRWRLVSSFSAFFRSCLGRCTAKILDVSFRLELRMERIFGMVAPPTSNS